MKFSIITIFPEVFNFYLNTSILRRAREKKLVDFDIYNLRDFSSDKKHSNIDDSPYGGGAGMVLMAGPILKAVDNIISKKTKKLRTKVIILSAKGKQFNQKIAYDFSKKFDRFILISGRYEGIDERVKKILKASEVSIGPYVLTDGDVASMAIISAISRLVPGVIKFESLKEESHDDILEYPHYTRPEIIKYKNKKYIVPKVLLSGDHKKIEDWRRKNKKPNL